MESNAKKECCRKELLKSIMEQDFAAYELQLFLDTHPGDQEAMQLFAEYTKQSKALKEKYQSTYGPITASGTMPGNEWQWIRSPWTWE